MDCLKNIICVFVCVQTGNLYVHFHKQSIHNRIISSNLASSTTWESFFLFFLNLPYFLIGLSQFFGFTCNSKLFIFNGYVFRSSSRFPNLCLQFLFLSPSMWLSVMLGLFIWTRYYYLCCQIVGPSVINYLQIYASINLYNKVLNW